MSSANIGTAVNIRNNSAATSFPPTPHRKNAARPFQRSESPYQQRTSAKDNPTQQVIKQVVDFLIEQLQQDKSKMLTAYLTAMAQFHFYFFWQHPFDCQAAVQCLPCSGYSHMERVRPLREKGEKGIMILALIMGFSRRKDDGTDEDAATQRPQVLIGFRAVHVFDVSQTEGAEPPEMNHTISGEVGEHRDRLFDFIQQQNITLEYNERIAPALGHFYCGQNGDISIAL